jgi:hypothetical protein
MVFDGGRLTSDVGILLLTAIEQRLGIAQRLADCIEDPRAPERVWLGFADSGGSRPPFRFDLARRSEMISPAIPG